LENADWRYSIDLLQVSKWKAAQRSECEKQKMKGAMDYDWPNLGGGGRGGEDDDDDNHHHHDHDELNVH
jgi:hypothetical protein